MGPPSKCLALHGMFVWLPVTLPAQPAWPVAPCLLPLLCSAVTLREAFPGPIENRSRLHTLALAHPPLLAAVLPSIASAPSNTAGAAGCTSLCRLLSPLTPQLQEPRKPSLLSPFNPMPGSELAWPRHLGNGPTSLSTCLPCLTATTAVALWLRRCGRRRVLARLSDRNPCFPDWEGLAWCV